MTKRILVYRPLNEDQLARLERDFRVDYLPKIDSAEDPAFLDALVNAHGLVGASLPITPALLDRAPNLEAIASISVGYDNYPVDELTRRGILLCNTPDVLTETTADTGFLLIMCAARRAIELAGMVQRGEWHESIGKEWFGTDVHGKTLGMVGFGRIGAAIARRGALASACGAVFERLAQARTRGRTRCPAPRTRCPARRGRHRLRHRALNADTHHLIGAREFALMKPSAIFVNVARGKVVDEAALIEALRAGTPHAAGLDVFEREPLPETSPLRHMPNVVALPHIGSATHETRTAMADRAVANILAALNGEQPPSPVNEVGPTHS